METILVTGASGFVGENLIRRLVQQKNTTVLALYRKIPEKSIQNEQIHQIQANLENYQETLLLLSKYKITAVYHLASMSVVRECDNNPHAAYRANVLGTINLLECLRTTQGETLRKVVATSTCRVYKDSTIPCDEQTVESPEDTYSFTKMCQDVICKNYYENYSLPINIVRLSNVYGPGDKTLSRLIPATITAVREGKAPTVYSSVQDNKVDFVYIDDVTEAILTVCEKADPGELFCVGSGRNASILSVVEKISTLLNSSLETKIIESSHKKELGRHINIAKLTALGWSPKIDLDEGLKRSTSL